MCQELFGKFMGPKSPVSVRICSLILNKCLICVNLLFVDRSKQTKFLCLVVLDIVRSRGKCA